MANSFFDRNWWKDFVVAILATTVSIVLTFGTASLVDRKKHRDERKLTALMVMSSIESFSRSAENVAATWDRIDTIAVWLLGLPLNEVARLGDEPFDEAIVEAFGTPVLSFDKTAETIFSSGLETWKNVDNFQFIDNVGNCFTEMSWIEEQHKAFSEDYRAGMARIYDNPTAYEGDCLTEKLLRNTQVRQQLLQPHEYKQWLLYCAEHLRLLNRRSMKLIGISEQEVMKFTDARNAADEDDEQDIDYADFRKPHPSKEAIDANLDYAIKLEQLK